MFLDFALLTDQQGELLDQIEFQAKQAANYVEDANEGVHEAIEYQKKVWKKQWYVLLSSVSFVIVLVGDIICSHMCIPSVGSLPLPWWPLSLSSLQRV